MSRPNVAICVPSQDHCAAWFAYDWARLAAYSAASGIGVSFGLVKNAYLPAMRKALAEHALAAGASHLLFLDSDMRFPKDALVRLLKHREPVVAASYSMRRMPLGPVAFDTTENQRAPHYIADDATGLEEVAMVGMGCFLVRADVFDRIEPPWFATPYDEALDDFVGEDVWFCRRLKDAGYRIMVDAALTNEMQHLGEWAFSNQQLNEWTARKAEAEAVGC